MKKIPTYWKVIKPYRIFPNKHTSVAVQRETVCNMFLWCLISLHLGPTHHVSHSSWGGTYLNYFKSQSLSTPTAALPLTTWPDGPSLQILWCTVPCAALILQPPWGRSRKEKWRREREPRGSGCSWSHRWRRPEGLTLTLHGPHAAHGLLGGQPWFRVS